MEVQIAVIHNGGRRKSAGKHRMPRTETHQPSGPARMRTLMKPRYLLGASLALLLAGGAAIFQPEARARLCAAQDGKWAGATNSCITRACYADHTCGIWASPARFCARLHLNDPISEVYFQLGEPSGIENGNYRWRAGKMSSLNIIATFSQDRLASLTVKADPGVQPEEVTIPRACIIGAQAGNHQ